MLAYDQVKAYDCVVKAYTIRASLERFNLPEGFIDYVLSNLENASSCFKTFYGPTEELVVESSGKGILCHRLYTFASLTRFMKG